MATNEVFTLSESSIRKVADAVQAITNEDMRRRANAASVPRPAQAGELYTGTTTTNEEYPDYPSATGNTFVVRLTDVRFDEQPGQQAVESQSSELYVIARTQDGSYIPIGTAVRLERRKSRSGLRWWIVPTVASLAIRYIKLNDTLTPGSAALGRLMTYSISGGWEELDEESDDVILSDYDTGPDTVNLETGATSPGRNFGLAGEIFPCYYDEQLVDDSTFSGDVTWENGGYSILGSWGLIRYGKVTETVSPGDPAGTPAIALGEYGEVTIYRGGTAGGDHEPVITSPAVTVQAIPLKWVWERGLAENEKVVIEYQTDQGRWIIRPKYLSKFVFFELDADRDESAPEEDVSALIKMAIGLEYTEDDPIDVTFRDSEFPMSKSGAVGKAIYDELTDKYWVVQCDQVGQFFKGTVSSSFGVTAGSVTLSSVVNLSPHPFSQDTTHTVALNQLPLAGMANDTAYCLWNHSAKSLSLINVTPHAFSPVLSLQLNANKTYIQGWTPTLYGYGNVTLGAWNNLISVGTCTLAGGA